MVKCFVITQSSSAWNQLNSSATSDSVMQFYIFKYLKCSVLWACVAFHHIFSYLKAVKKVLKKKEPRFSSPNSLFKTVWVNAHRSFIGLNVCSTGLTEPQKAAEDIMWLVLLFKRIQVETLKECLCYCPLIGNPVSHAAKGNLANCKAVTLSLSKAKE